MPVRYKDRLMLVTSAAAMVLVAANGDARAQSPMQGYDLRGTQAPYSQTDAQTPGGYDSGAQDSVSDAYGEPNVSANSTASSSNSSATESNANPDANSSAGSGAGSDASSSTNPRANAAGSAAAGAGVSNSGTTAQDPAGRSNYGRPKLKKSNLYQLPVLEKPRKPGFPKLPPLTTYKSYIGDGATRRLRKNESTAKPDIEGTDPAPTVAALPVLPHPPKPKPDEKPFDPLGVDVGSLRLFPYVEADTGYDSNPNLLAEAVKGSSYLHGETGMRLESEWSQHSLTGEFHAGYYDYFSVPEASRPDANGKLNGRVDLTKFTKLNFESRFSLSTQQPGSAQLAVPGSVTITNRPLVATFGQTVGASQTFNRLTLDLSGTFDRIVFGDATQSDGTELLLSENDYNTYGIVGRASYELTPGMIPFAELRADERRYDGYFDGDGFARDSDGIAAKLGTKFELTRLLTGEIAAGYSERAYADPRLGNLKAPTIDANLVYTASPLTTLTLAAVTDLSETTVANSSGAISRVFSAKLAHALLRNLTLTGTASYQINQYQGVPLTEFVYSAGIGAEYNLTRSVVIRGSFTHARLSSNLAGDDYTSNVFLVGLKLQR